MKQFLLKALLCIPFFCIAKPGFSQTLDLGSLESFTCYTGDGAITNYGTSSFTGDIGSNLGIISGFDAPTTVTGTIHNADAKTQQARIDLLNVYIHLNDLPITKTHAAAFGSETITAGVYNIQGGAGSVGGSLILDGQNNANAAFVIKYEGAMTVAAGTTVILANGTLPCNVFWIAEGAISMGASVTMKGTLIAHSGAVSMGTGGDLEGRMISLSGAITFGPGISAKPSCLSTIPINCVNNSTNTTLGTAANFALFTTSGAVANTGISGVIGDIGTDLGAVSGLESSVVVGNVYNADATTNQASADLQAGYTQLFTTPATNTTHPAVFGNGETLTAGVYSVGTAGSLAGELTLDGGGNPNAVFIFKIGAAFSVGAESRITLINGTRRCNVFWIAEGAISIGAFSKLKGSFIAHTDAASLGANGFLEGNLFSIGGAVNLNTSTAYISYSLCSYSVLPIKLLSFTGSCEKQHAVVKWSTATETNNNSFIIERSRDGSSWQKIGTVAGAGSSTLLHDYSFTDDQVSNEANNYYRLRQTDHDNHFTYSNTITVQNCGSKKAENLSVFPNPSSGRFNLVLTSDQHAVSSTEIFNSQGAVIYQSNIFQPTVDLSNKAPGVYLLRVVSGSKITTSKLVVKK